MNLKLTSLNYLMKHVQFVKINSFENFRPARHNKILQRVYILKLKMHGQQRNDGYNLSSRFLSFFRRHLQRIKLTEAGLACRNVRLPFVSFWHESRMHGGFQFDMHKAHNVYKNLKNI